MYAIIEAGGHQHRVQPDSIIAVNRLALDAGAAFETDRVLLCGDEGAAVEIGAPYVAGAKVTGTVLDHVRAPKIIVFKFKRRKNYKRTRGHRQDLTRVLIQSIEVGGKSVGSTPKAKPAAKPKAEEEDKAEAAAKPAEAPQAKAKPAEKGKAAAPKRTPKAAASKAAGGSTRRTAAKAGDKGTAKAAPKTGTKAGAKGTAKARSKKPE